MADATVLDKRIVKGLVEEKLDPLPLPPGQKRVRSRRSLCRCCGDMMLAVVRYRDLCFPCGAANCTIHHPGPTCPGGMKTTAVSIADSYLHTVNFSIAGGIHDNGERDDDGLPLIDWVLLEHLAWRGRDTGTWDTVLSDRMHFKLPGYPPPDRSQKTLYQQYVGNGGGFDHLLQHQILTHRGWYYEHIEGYPPLLAYMGREAGLHAYFHSSSHCPSSADPVTFYGIYGDDEHMIPHPFRRVQEEMEEPLGLTALAQYDLAEAFMRPQDTNGVVLINRAMILNQHLLDLMILSGESDPPEVPPHELQTGILLWQRLQKEVKAFEDELVSRSKITRKAATAGLLLRQLLDTTTRYVQELVLLEF